MIAEGIADNNFIIDPVTGLVTLATSDLDRETKSSYIVTGKFQHQHCVVLMKAFTFCFIHAIGYLL